MYYPTFTREDNQETNGVRVTVFVCDTLTGPVQYKYKTSNFFKSYWSPKVHKILWLNTTKADNQVPKGFRATILLPYMLTQSTEYTYKISSNYSNQVIGHTRFYKKGGKQKHYSSESCQSCKTNFSDILAKYHQAILKGRGLSYQVHKIVIPKLLEEITKKISEWELPSLYETCLLDLSNLCANMIKLFQ